MECTRHCPIGSRTVSGEIKTAQAILDEVLQDQLFYGQDGGMTVTGGEPLMQPDFTYALLSLAREHGINTAIESCVYAPWKTVERILPLVDTAILDIKHLDDAAHTRCTGVGNRQILENIENISQKLQIPIIIRMPVVPGCNDSEANIHALGAFISNHVPTCQEVGLLAYHRLGESKRDGIGYTVSDFSADPPSDELMQWYKDIIRGYGLPVK